MREEWNGPIILKGILSVEDAKMAVKAGMDGIWVSNHGGRQLDAVPAAIDVLPEIAAAVGDKTKILFDSGIRSGVDILRAVALGADFAFLGRPFLYGVCALGDKGANHVHDLLTHDLVNNMIQLGVDNLEDVRKVETRRA